jgi:hypothetical protein
MFKKSVVVAVAINIKGIGSGGWLEERAFSIRLSVPKGKK